jgi:hypothetical protein
MIEISYKQHDEIVDQIVTVAVLVAGGVIFSTQANAQSAGVSTMSAGSTQCGSGSGGSDCYICPAE